MKSFVTGLLETALFAGLVVVGGAFARALYELAALGWGIF